MDYGEQTQATNNRMSKPAWKLVLNVSGAAFLVALFGLYEAVRWVTERWRVKGG